MTAPLPPAPARGAKLTHRLGRLLLLAVVLVGALGGWRLYQIALATRTFVVALQPEANPFGEMVPTVLQPEDLLAMMDLRVSLRDGTRLADVPAGQSTGSLRTKGAAQRNAVDKVQIEARLHYPGSDAERIAWSELDLDTREDTLVVVLSRESARRFLESEVTCSFAIRTPEGDAMPGVADVGGYLEPSPDKPGVYVFSLRADDLLTMLDRGDTHHGLSALGGVDRFQLDVPLEWFLRLGENHVLTVQRITTPVVEVLPLVESFSPQRVVAQQWNGELSLRGRDLDLVESVWLQGGTQRIAAPIATRGLDGLSVRPGALAVGSYRIGIGWRGQEQVLAGRFEVAAGYALLEPADGVSVVRGDAVNVRWQAPADAGEVVVEATNDAAAGAWWQIYRGDSAAGRCAWPTESLAAEDEGTVRLRVSWPGQASIRPLERSVQLVPPARITIKLRFRLDGAEYGRINGVRVDGETVPIGDDPVIVPVSVVPGSHRIQATAPLLDPYAGTFEAAFEGQIIDIELR